MLNKFYSNSNDDSINLSIPFFSRIIRFGLVLILVVPACLLFSSCSIKKRTSDQLVLAADGKSDYQVVIPDESSSPEVREWLETSAGLVKDAFEANRVFISVVLESDHDKSKPGIYLGDTEFARSKDIEVSRFKHWSYIHRVAGNNLIIAGSETLTSLGLVKGVCDFLREYAGTFFLYPGRTGIEFTKTPLIAVPEDLNVEINPILQFNINTGSQGMDLYHIANNQFSTSRFSPHMYSTAIPHGKYFKTHPEYFALVKGKRSERKSQYCISNPEVQQLLLEYLIHSSEGSQILSIGQNDGFQKCECENCYKLYNTGDDWCDKLWIFHTWLAEEVQKVNPDVTALLVSYQPTTMPPGRFKTFPDNVMIMTTHSEKETLEMWDEYTVPRGFAVYTYNWGTYHMVSYLPKKTPAFIETEVRRLYRQNVTGIFQDGYCCCLGLEGPAYYVFGRMFDNPEELSAADLCEEYYSAAFNEAVEPMRKFFDMFYRDLELYSEWLGPRSPAQRIIPLGRKPESVEDPLDWVRKSTARFGAIGTQRFISDPDKLLKLVYAPDMVLTMEHHLKQAEALATSAKVKQRLNLIRMEFDYLRNIMTVVHLYNAYKVHPNEATHVRLLEGIDRWNALLDSYYDENGRMKPLPGWPEMVLLRGHSRSSIGLITTRWWNTYNKAKEDNPFTWDTDEIRKKGNMD